MRAWKEKKARETDCATPRDAAAFDAATHLDEGKRRDNAARPSLAHSCPHRRSSTHPSVAARPSSCARCHSRLSASPQRRARPFAVPLRCPVQTSRAPARTWCAGKKKGNRRRKDKPHVEARTSWGRERADSNAGKKAKVIQLARTAPVTVWARRKEETKDRKGESVRWDSFSEEMAVQQVGRQRLTTALGEGGKGAECETCPKDRQTKSKRMRERRGVARRGWESEEMGVLKTSK